MQLVNWDSRQIVLDLNGKYGELKPFSKRETPFLGVLVSGAQHQQINFE